LTPAAFATRVQRVISDLTKASNSSGEVPAGSMPSSSSFLVHRYALLSDEEATATAIAIWERTNLANLEDNILPTRPRATLILKKGADHEVQTVSLRRL
jgi:hypothetical protein